MIFVTEFSPYLYSFHSISTGQKIASFVVCYVYHIVGAQNIVTLFHSFFYILPTLIERKKQVICCKMILL